VNHFVALINSSDDQSLSVLYFICDSLRICFREPMSLSDEQTLHCLRSLSTILAHRTKSPCVTDRLCIAASKSLLNALNNNEGRMRFMLSDIDSRMDTAIDTIARTIATARPKLTEPLAHAPGRSRSHSYSRSRSPTESLQQWDEKDNGNADDNEVADGSDRARQQHEDHAAFISVIHHCIRVVYMMCCQR
jgi:hypothetical protein